MLPRGSPNWVCLRLGCPPQPLVPASRSSVGRSHCWPAGLACWAALQPKREARAPVGCLPWCLEVCAVLLRAAASVTQISGSGCALATCCKTPSQTPNSFSETSASLRHSLAQSILSSAAQLSKHPSPSASGSNTRWTPSPLSRAQQPHAHPVNNCLRSKQPNTCANTTNTQLSHNTPLHINHGGTSPLLCNPKYPQKLTTTALPSSAA